MTMIVLVGYIEVHPLQEGGVHAKLTEACAGLQVWKVSWLKSNMYICLCYNYYRVKTTIDSSSDSDFEEKPVPKVAHTAISSDDSEVQ